MHNLEFIRRIHLDLTGLPPSPEQVRAFITDSADSRWKRDQLIDQLIASPDFTDHWTNKWCDLLQVNSKFLGSEGAKLFRNWVRDQIAKNVPHDQFVRSILTATGSNKENPAASYFKILREPVELMENTTHLFLATRFNCNKCHDHPFERWTQDQYYEMSAFFAQTGLERDPASGDGKIGGTDVEGAKPLFEKVFDRKEGEVKHDRTGAITPPVFPYAAKVKTADDASRREKLADWITSPDNIYFARSFVNRIWGYLNGVGLIEPLDDIRAGNPPSNPELLDWMGQEFIAKGFDFRHMVRQICRSRTYQLSIQTNQWNADDKTNFSHATARRLPAETLLDSIYKVTGTTPEIPGVARGVRAGQLPDSNIGLKDGFLANLGRPVRESACECERSTDLQLGPIMALISGPTVGDAISGSGNALAKLVADHPDDRELVGEVFMRVLNRPASEAESSSALAMLQEMAPEHAELLTARDARAAEIAPAWEIKTKARDAAIEQAKAGLEKVTVELAPATAQRLKEQQERIAALEKSFAEADALTPAGLAAWITPPAGQKAWTDPLPDKAESNGEAKLAIQPDRAILVSGGLGKIIYTVTLPVPPGPLTGLRLEALPEAGKLGRSGSGNFVLTEIEATLTPMADGKAGAGQALKFTEATATTNQGGYNVKSAIDGNATAETGNGWGVAPAVDKAQTATFTCQQAPTMGGLLTVRLHQVFSDGQHAMAHFRLGLLVEETLLPILAVEASQRTPEQRGALTTFFRKHDSGMAQLTKDLTAARQPLPDDPKMAAAKAVLATAGLPVPLDPRLERLRNDVELSAGQLKNQRLTATQDLTWALINTPAFLFNH